MWWRGYLDWEGNDVHFMGSAYTGRYATTIAALGGIDASDTPTLSGRDLSPVLADPGASVRDFVLFSQDSAQSEILRNTRYAVRGFYDGETKYARYYGVGGASGATEPPTPRASSSMWTPNSTTTTMSGTRPRRTPTSSSTWPTTEAAAMSCAPCSAVCWTMRQRS